MKKQVDKVPSGRFLARLTPELHREVVEAAKREGVSLNLYVSTVLARSLGRKEGFDYGKWAGTMLERAKKRSKNYHLKTPQQQWEEDKKLGILDWDGSHD